MVCVLTHSKIDTGDASPRAVTSDGTRWKLPQTVAALRSFSGAGSLKLHQYNSTFTAHRQIIGREYETRPIGTMILIVANKRQ